MYSKFTYPYNVQCSPPLIRSNFSINFPPSSLALPSEVSCLYRPAPHIHLPVNSLHHPQHSGQRPEAMVKSYWSLEVAVHTGAVLPGDKGQSWVGQVRLNVPALLPGAMKVSSAQFILWPQLVNRASPTSTEFWFVIKFFNSWPGHIIPLKIGEWLYRCTCYSLGLILDGNHLEGLARRCLSRVNNGCWFAVAFSVYSLCLNFIAHKLGQGANCRFAWIDIFHQILYLFNLHQRQSRKKSFFQNQAFCLIFVK